MNTVVIASTEADANAAAAIEQHHAEMTGALTLRVEALIAGAGHRDTAVARSAQTELVSWCEHELLPHALAEEDSLYPAARGKDEGRLFVEGMLADHNEIANLVQHVATSTDMVRAAAAAQALLVLFTGHQAKENELLLPMLVAAPDVAVADLLGQMHELFEHERQADHAEGDHADSGCGHHGCTCGQEDGPRYPELDARAVPHAIRHTTVFGALDSVRAGDGLVLVAPHDPVPLLAQLEQRAPGAFQVDYLQQGPDAWRLLFRRRVTD